MDAVSEVKGRLSIEDVIGEYVRLKRTGKNYKGLSPFTNEKTPSFVVSPEKQIWHDFSSGRGGDMFTFVQEVEGLDFRGSLELLARKAGVDLGQFEKKPGSSKLDKERLYDCLELAARFYQSQLKAKPQALDYLLKKRGFLKPTVLDFRLGYSPDNQRSLTDFLVKKGFSVNEVKLAGLSVERRGGIGDMFRGRVMVPLCDSFGRVVGFTARLLVDKEGAPKYINTPSTPLYDKSRHVYGLHLAKQAIRDKKFSIIAEGNLDVVASHQAGHKNVVATAGTALTQQQLKALGRFSPDVRLAFDADRAGVEAAERAIPIASAAGVNLSVITLPEGKDPDELIRKNPAAWERAIASHEYALDWLLTQYDKKLDLSSALGKRQFSDIIVDVLRGLKDEVERDHYVKSVSEKLGIESDSLRAKLKNAHSGSAKLKLVKNKPVEKEDFAERSRAIEHLLSLALMLPGTRGYLEKLTSEMLVSQSHKAVFEYLVDHPEFSGNLQDAPQLREVGDFVKILSLQFEELYGQVDTLELQYEAARLRARIIEYFAKDQKRKLSAALAGDDLNESQKREVLEKVKDLDQLLNSIKTD